jgi:superfamily II DNA or RNA helicase
MTEFEPGVYELLVTSEVERRLRLVEPERVRREPLDDADAHEALSRYIAEIVRLALRSVAGGADGVRRQVTLANEIASAIAGLSIAGGEADPIAASRDVLQTIAARREVPGDVRFPALPTVPLSTSALLVNGREQPRIGAEIQRELESADRVDLLCAFVQWHGLRVIERSLEEQLKRCGRGRLRVITTTYMGATQRKALDRLVELGADVRVSYETRSTRLHAKAWLFHRTTGYSTGYVGSSNLSKSALLDGLEWNVRVSAIEQPHLLDTCQATFDEYWEDPSFEPYDPADSVQRDRLDRALSEERGGHLTSEVQLSGLDVTPYPYQREILEELLAERAVHDSWRNLVVMATGTGKTVVAALDYRRLRNSGTVNTLLFVAHRDEILIQSQSAFRHVMRQPAFGERLVGGDRPDDWRYVFASVQSLAQLDLTALDRNRFDMIVIDEFHRAMAPTYRALLEHFEPKVLLGLTATPERADGQNVTSWFGGRTAIELRLWEALERGLLAPFQYFGINDETDLSSLEWRRGHGYDERVLEGLYTGHHARARIVASATERVVADVRSMRALGFCVSVGHARFMAEQFTKLGIPAVALTGADRTEDRREAISRLLRREVNVIFTVELFNEGVDIPEVDTVLFLRPTESATIFLQQLGRGLRLADDKACLTVLDFIGNQHAEFRFDLRLRALTGVTRRGLERQIREGFPTLPAGCHISLDRVVADRVLANVRSSLRIDWKGLVSELRAIGDVPIGAFLQETGIDLDDLYRRHRGGWAGLRRLAGFADASSTSDDDKLARAVGRMLHIDDLERLNFLAAQLSQHAPPTWESLDPRSRRLAAMLHYSLWGWNEPITAVNACMQRLWTNPARRQELAELVDVLRNRVHRVTRPVAAAGPNPLQVHARYSLAELLAAFGVTNPSAARGSGVKQIPDEQADVFWFNLRKTERHFSPTTMYADRALSPRLFQWESQSTTSEASPTGQRYIHHRERGTSVHLFFRDTKEADGDLGAPPYLYAGPARYVSHQGDRPLRILWQLEYELPADVFHSAKVAAG